LLVLDALRKGVRPSDIWKNYPISERSVKYVLRKLRDVGLVKKLGYGTWEVVEGSQRDPTRCKIVHRVASPHTPPKVQKKVQNLKPDTVRGHGIVATIKVARHRFVNWNDRDKILEARDIPYTPIPQGQRISVGKIEKAWLTSKSIVFYYPRGYSWFGDTAREVAGAILEDVIDHIGKVEKLLGIDTLKIRGRYHVKFSRQHYALIRNGLARYYNDPRRKLEVRDDGGLWLLIDNSFNLEELETVHPETAVTDNKFVQDFFNDQKKNPEVTASFILNSFNMTQEQLREAHSHLAMYAQNLQTHVGAVNNLSAQAQENAKTTTSLREAVERLAMAFGDMTMAPARKKRGVILAPDKVDKTPSPPLEARLEKKECGLCGEVQEIPQGKTVCAECEKIIATRKKHVTMASLDNYLA